MSASPVATARGGSWVPEQRAQRPGARLRGEASGAGLESGR